MKNADKQVTRPRCYFDTNLNFTDQQNHLSSNGRADHRRDIRKMGIMKIRTRIRAVFMTHGQNDLCTMIGQIGFFSLIERIQRTPLSGCNRT